MIDCDPLFLSFLPQKKTVFQCNFFSVVQLHQEGLQLPRVVGRKRRSVVETHGAEKGAARRQNFAGAVKRVAIGRNTHVDWHKTPKIHGNCMVSRHIFFLCFF